MTSSTCGQCGFASPAGMKFCGGCGQPLAAPEAADNGAQRLHVTVMFCDLVGSTQLVGSRDPEDYRELLGAYQRLCEAAVGRYDGWAAQWAGDGLVAYFGYPRAHEDDAQRAIHAGLAIIDELGRLSTRVGVELRARVGLHSGVVVAGELGTGGARLERAVIGTTPHVAARLQSLAAPSTVVVSDAVRALIDPYFELEPLGEHELKGVDRPVAVHRVLRPSGAGGRIEIVGPRAAAPMFGRDAELGELVAAWEEAARGRGGIVHIPGEAGIGKSRLVRALTEHVGSAHVWQCSSHHRSTTLYPVDQYLERRHVALPEVPAETSPSEARAATLRAIVALLAEDAVRDPLLLVVEDLHWADPTTVELLGRLAAELQNQAILCVATYRGEFAPPWSAGRTLKLGPLSAADVRAMVAASGLDTDLSGADGVPLFVEELLKMIAAGGGTLGDRADSTVTAVPPTLQGLLTQRLERLRDHRDVIDVAAVLGRDFELATLAALVALGGALASLAEHDVIRPVEGAPGRFEFTHALLQEAAYTRLLRQRRRALHRRVAELLTEQLTEREPELVAHHWRRAGEPARSVPYWIAAGEQAVGRAAFAEAADHFRRGLEALDRSASETGDRATLLVRLGGTLQAAVGYGADGVDVAYAEARRLGVQERLGSVVRGQWAFHLLRADYARAGEFADELLAIAERTGAPERLTDAHCARGLVHLYRGEFPLARAHLTEAAAHAAPRGETDWLSQIGGDAGVAALAYNSTVLWNLGEVDESLACSDLSLELAERAGGPVTRAQAWGMRALLHLSRAEPLEFARWTQRTRAHSVEHDVGYWRALASLLDGALRARGGELATGRAIVDAALDTYARSGSRLGVSRFAVLQAELSLAAGDQDGAFAGLAAAEAHVAATGERYSETELYRFKGRLLGSTDEATAAFERAVAVAREQGAVMLELRATTTLAQHNGTGRERLAELLARFPAELELDDLVRAREALVEGGVAA